MTTEQETKLLEDVADVKRAVLGDPHLDTPGLMKRMAIVEAWIGSTRLRIATISGAVTGLILVAKWLITGRPPL